MKKNGKDEIPRLVRKLGQREETLVTELSEEEINELQSQIVQMLNHEEKLEEKLAEVKKNYVSQISTSELQRNELRRQVNSRMRQEKVLVEDHLTASNEVVRIRSDTGRPVGILRTATPRELQEDLPLDRAAEQQNAAEGESDEFGATPEAFSGQTE